MIGRARRADNRGMRARTGSPGAVLPTALLMLAGVLATLAPTTAQAARPSSKLRVGTQALTLCASAPVAYCGTLSVPLDYSTPAGPRISIAYRFYPASAPPAPEL